MPMRNTVKCCWVFIIVLHLFAESARSQSLGGIFFGLNHYLNVDEDKWNNIDASGFSAGFILPMNIQKVSIFFKLKTSFHTVGPNYSYQYDRSIDHFLSVINEVLIGKQILPSNKFELLPQFGLGAIGESFYFDWNKGYCHGDYFVDFSLLLKRKSRIVDMGIMFNWENGLNKEVEGFLSSKRICTSFVIMK